MNFTYESLGSQSFLVYRISESDILDSMTLGMITNNKIPSIAPTIFTQMDSDRYVKYNISAKVSVKDFFGGLVNRKSLMGVLSGITDAVMAAEDYMIPIESLVFDLSYMFTDVSTRETMLVCLPLSSADNRVDLKKFIKEIMFNTRFDSAENCDYVVEINNYLNGPSAFSIADFQKLLNKLKEPTPTPNPRKPSFQESTPVRSEPNQPKSEPEHRSEPMKPKPDDSETSSQPIPHEPDRKDTDVAGQNISFFYLMQHFSKENLDKYEAQQKEKKQMKQHKKPTKPDEPGKERSLSFNIPGKKSEPVNPRSSPSAENAAQTPSYPASGARFNPESQHMETNRGASSHFGDTTYLSRDGAGDEAPTTILSPTSPAPQPRPYLIWQKNNERIEVDKEEFKIGRNKDYAHLVIADNRNVSGSHAKIVSRNMEFFVIDTNSTNHTFVNDKQIDINTEVKLSDGCALRFANEEFVFHMN